MKALLMALVVSVAGRVAEARDFVPADGAVERSQIDRDHVTVCYDRCWRLEYATGAWSVVPALPDLPDTPAPEPRVTFATTIHLCSPDCHDVQLPGIAAIAERDGQTVTLVPRPGCR